MREMTLAELQTQAWRSAFSGSHEEAARYEVEWHTKFAIPAACLVFGLTGAAFGRFRPARSLRGRLVLSVGVVFGYSALLWWGTRQATQLSVPPAVGVWLANVACAAVAGATLLRRARLALRSDD
jgi:lipopolysaccharide export system permease protein